MNNYLILERRGLWLVFCTVTHDFEVYQTRQEAEYHVYEALALAEITNAMLANLN